MRAKLVYSGNADVLLKTLTQFADNPHFDSYFNRLSHQINPTEPLFAIGFHNQSPGQIKLIYTLHTEYKLTRQLCKCVHIEQVFASKQLSTKVIEDFHKDLLPQLDCYKVVALGIQENSLLKPNQKFMTIQNKPML